MKKQFLEAGQIVNTHGIRGEVKIQSWCDSPEFLCRLSTLYLDGAPVAVRSARPHKGCVIALLDGVSDVNQAMLLKGKILQFSRDDVQLPAGHFFLEDILGLEVRDADSGAVLGTVSDILTPPANNVYVVSGGGRELMIPAVDEFVLETNIDGGYLRVRLLEGMGG